MKTKAFLLIFIFFTVQNLKSQYVNESEALDKLGWKLAVQAWTFKLFTLEETLDKLNKLGVKYIEIYPGQEIGGGIKGTTNFTADEQTLKKIDELLKSKGIKAVNYGVVNGNTEEEWVQIFEFAKALGIGTIITEPQARFVGHIESLSMKYKIKVGIHNHPKPTLYWNPETTLSILAARSNNLGITADIGHWVRSGLDPVHYINLFQGRITSLHFKDLNEFGIKKAHDVPWGVGVCNIPGVMHELKKQGFKGVFSIEYEYNWENSMPDVAESIAYFYRVANWLLKE